MLFIVSKSRSVTSSHRSTPSRTPVLHTTTLDLGDIGLSPQKGTTPDPRTPPRTVSSSSVHSSRQRTPSRSKPSSAASSSFDVTIKPA